jgi:hypothetical protein
MPSQFDCVLCDFLWQFPSFPLSSASCGDLQWGARLKESERLATKKHKGHKADWVHT